MALPYAELRGRVRHGEHAATMGVIGSSIVGTLIGRRPLRAGIHDSWQSDALTCIWPVLDEMPSAHHFNARYRSSYSFLRLARHSRTIKNRETLLNVTYLTVLLDS